MSAAVVKLPTAAPRKVKQTARGKGYMGALDNCARFPIEPRFDASPDTQAARRTAQRMLDADRTAIMQLAVALFATADADQQARVTGRLLGLQALNRPGAAEAMAWLEYEAAPKERKCLIDSLAATIVIEEGRL